jgi:aminodeoxyfutalosine synthase
MKSELDAILSKAATGKRINRSETLILASCNTIDHIHKLGRAALTNRTRRFGNKATYVINLAVNPSNICDGKCGFCHYHTSEGDARAYVLTEKEILRRVRKTTPSEIHITGGMNRFWTFPKACELIRKIWELQPGIHIKAYTAVEIDRFAKNEKASVTDILTILKEAGLQSLTGGGAELFSERMRKKYCPSKISPETWLSIHREAHKLGLSTNATMLYGLGESAEEITDHLHALRNMQDNSKGFSCFIPLAYQPSQDDPKDRGPSPLENLRIIALARLVLDNFPHIKAYWPMIGTETAATGLSWGADDLDGTLGEEKIAHAGAAKSPTSLNHKMMKETIRLGGFTAVERDGVFKRVRRKDPSNE